MSDQPKQLTDEQILAGLPDQLPPLDVDDVRRGARLIELRREEARQQFEREGQAEADAEAAYRQAKAVAYAEAAVEANSPQDEAKLHADGETAELRAIRDKHHVLAKAALLRIDELEAKRAMLRHASERSAGLEGTQPS